MSVTERPILFNGEMVRAILEGRKTQTRRIVKPQPEQPAAGSYFDAYNGGPQWNWWASDHRQHLDQIINCPFGKPGDRLWVRETWSDVNLQGAPGIAYRADDDIRDLMEEPSFLDEHGTFNYDDERVEPYHFAVWSEDLLSGSEGRWRPSIHMPRWASRITLEITDVRVERVCDITESDAEAEGVQEEWRNGEVHGSAKDVFSRLWESINGTGSWSANPWVWVIEFNQVNAKQEAA